MIVWFSQFKNFFHFLFSIYIMFCCRIVHRVEPRLWRLLNICASWFGALELVTMRMMMLMLMLMLMLMNWRGTYILFCRGSNRRCWRCRLRRLAGLSCLLRWSNWRLLPLLRWMLLPLWLRSGLCYWCRLLLRPLLSWFCVCWLCWS